jgi:hypothetical protein
MTAHLCFPSVGGFGQIADRSTERRVFTCLLRRALTTAISSFSPCYTLEMVRKAVPSLFAFGMLIGCTSLFSTDTFVQKTLDTPNDLPLDGSIPRDTGVVVKSKDAEALLDAESMPDGRINLDAAAGLDADGESGAGPQEFVIANNACTNSRCRGGDGGLKDARGDSTATKLCVERGRPTLMSYTIGSAMPGGKFCWFEGGAASCDPNCTGCNLLLTVTCR